MDGRCLGLILESTHLDGVNPFCIYLLILFSFSFLFFYFIVYIIHTKHPFLPTNLDPDMSESPFDAKQSTFDDDAKSATEYDHQPDGELDDDAAQISGGGGGSDDDAGGGNSDNESLLSDLDDHDFQDFDLENIDIEERPAIAVDQSNVNLIGVHKRKRDGPDDGSKKRREGRREKKTRRRPTATGEDEGDDGGRSGRAGGSLSSSRRKTAEKSSKGRKTRDDIDDDSLTPEERRKRALDRKMDEALKRTGQRFRKVVCLARKKRLARL